MAHSGTANDNSNPAMHLEPKAAHHNNGQHNGGYADTELGQQTSAQGLLSGGQPIGRQISVTLSELRDRHKKGFCNVLTDRLKFA